MDDSTAQQQQLFLVGLLQVPSSSLAHLVSSPSSPVYSTLAALLTAYPAHQASRHLLHSVIARLAQSRNALPVPLLAWYAHQFLPTNRSRVAAVIADAIAATPKLAQQLAATLPEALRVALESESESESAAIVCSLIRAIAITGTVLTPQGFQHLVKTIRQHYPPPNNGTDDRLRLALVETVHDLVLACASNLGVDVLHPVLEAMLLSHDKDSIAADLATLYPSLADDLSRLVLGAVGPVARSTKDLIARFRRTAPHSQGGKDLEWFTRLRRAQEEEEKRRTTHDKEAPGSSGRDKDDSVAAKDKGKTTAAVASPLTAEREAELTKVRGRGTDPLTRERENLADSLLQYCCAPLSPRGQPYQAVTAILDLFPSEPPAFLRACLLHPRFASGSSSAGGAGKDVEHAQEQVVEALLSDSGSSFPDELTRIRLGLLDVDDGGGGGAANSAEAASSGAPRSVKVVEEEAAPVATIERRNVYDNDKYFRRGKILLPTASTRAQTLRHHRVVELDERLKQSILALAERESSDDDEEEEEEHLDASEGGGVVRRKTYGFLEEEDEGTANPRIRIGGADEEPDENEQEADVNDGRDRSYAQSRVSDFLVFPLLSSCHSLSLSLFGSKPGSASFFGFRRSRGREFPSCSFLSLSPD